MLFEGDSVERPSSETLYESLPSGGRSLVCLETEFGEEPVDFPEQLLVFVEFRNAKEKDQNGFLKEKSDQIWVVFVELDE